MVKTSRSNIGGREPYNELQSWLPIWSSASGGARGCFPSRRSAAKAATATIRIAPQPAPIRSSRAWPQAQVRPAMLPALLLSAVVGRSGWACCACSPANTSRLVNQTNSNAEAISRDLMAAARALGKQLLVLPASTQHEIDRQFAVFVHSEPTRSSSALTPSSTASGSHRGAGCASCDAGDL